MKLEDLAKSLDFIFDALHRWYRCLTTRSNECRDILSIAANPSDAIRRALSVWFTSFFLSLLVTAWVYQLYGVGFGNMSFHLAQSLLMLMFLFATVMCIHAGLSLFKVNTSFETVFVTWTVYASAFGPINSLLASPTFAANIFHLKELKTKAKTQELTLSLFLNIYSDQSNTLLYTVAAVLGTLVVPFSLLQIGRMLDAVAMSSSLERVKVFSGGSLGVIVAIVPLQLLGILYQMLIYSFL